MNKIFKESRWVVWQAEEVKGRMTKVPYSVTGKRASSTDPETWTTYAKAKKAAEFFSGIGVVFTPDETLLGIDIDHVIENKTVIGEHRDEIAALLKRADTYCEISPSGTGLHLYLALTDPLTLSANRHAPFEAYTSGRFFTFTEQSFPTKKPKPIRTVTPEEAEAILATIGYPWKKIESTQVKAAPSQKFFDDDADVLQAMFRSRHGEDIRALYDGDASAYKDDLSRADAALLNHLAFWTGKDASAMERLWLASPLGAREKTQKREDYRKRSIENAIAHCKEVYIPPTAGIDFMTVRGTKGEKIVLVNVENVCRALRMHPSFAGRFRFDEFSQTFEIREGDAWRALEDVDIIHEQARLSMTFPFFAKIGKEMVYDAIIRVSKEHKIDSAIDFVKSLVWDGKERLNHWLTHVYGVEDDEYHQTVGSNWLKGMVKRIVEPGCKFDYVLVLEGEQGVRKSTSLHVLGEVNGKSWHVETTMSVDSKDFFMQMQGKSIVEFSEGETLSRTEVKKMKAIITMQYDKFRPPYGRVSMDFPRRCVFAMTTNQDEYLKDETGNRRWLPVRVLKDKADVEWLMANRDQLFAEAYARLEKGETTYEFPEEEMAKQQAARRVSDPNTEQIVHWYLTDPFLTDTMKYEFGITPDMVWKQALSGFGPLKKADEMAICGVLRDVLKLAKRRKMVDGIQSVRWFGNSVESKAVEEELRHVVAE